MKNELVIKKCKSCNAMVKVLKDCNCENCGIKCCGEEMEALSPNSVDAAIEKHVPTYEVLEGNMEVKVNHVMEDDHYIMWIKLVYENSEQTIYFKPGEAPEAHCKYEPGMKIYAYCNKHGLWVRDVV